MDGFTIDQRLDVDAIADWGSAWLEAEISSGVAPPEAIARLKAATPLIASALAAMRAAEAVRFR
jgi:hypothetical protein